MGSDLEGEAPEPASAGGRLDSSARRDMLLDAAAQLAIAESPEAVTMELVAEKCGVSRPLVYKHFANRQELLGALYRREARRLHVEMVGLVEAADSIEAMFRALVQGALRAAGERGHLIAALRSGGSSKEVRREQRDRDRRTTRAFARRAIEELDMDPERTVLTVSLLLSLIDSVLVQWRTEPTRSRAEQLESAYMTIVIATLGTLSGTAA
jgi:AcrR family transcriptional regulator